MRFGGWRLNGRHGQTGSRNSARARAQSYGPQSFQRFSCAFAQLFFALEARRFGRPGAPFASARRKGPPDCRDDRPMSSDDARRPVAFRAPAKPKTRESETFRRFRDGGAKSLKSLGGEMSDFAGSFVFKDLTAFSFRALATCARPARKGRGERIVKRPVPGPRS